MTPLNCTNLTNQKLSFKEKHRLRARCALSTRIFWYDAHLHTNIPNQRTSKLPSICNSITPLANNTKAKKICSLIWILKTSLN